MKGVNLVLIMGRLGKDPEVQKLANGTTVARFTVATSKVWKDKQGEKKEKTEWHRVVAWGKLGEICGEYLSKGSQVHVQGELSTRSWDDQQTGQKKYATEIVASQVQFVGGKSEGGGNRSSSNGNSSRSNSAPADDYDSDGQEPDFSEDDIPF